VAITGDSGSARAALAVVEDCGQLALFALGGEPVVLIHSDEDGGQLTLFDDEGERVLTLPDDAHLL